MKDKSKHISISAVSLIKLSAVICIAFICFNAGYLKSQNDFNKYSNSYTVTVDSATSQETEEKPKNQGVIKKLININTASAEELETLNGVGPVLARRIIEYREANGAFEHRFSIMNVSGIGSSIYEDIKDEICVE